MYKPTLKQAESYIKDYKVIPLCREIYADSKTPIALLKNIASKSDRFYLLESVEGGEKWGRYSFLGFDPAEEIKCKNGSIVIKNFNNELEKKGNPSDIIREILLDYTTPKFDFMPPFTGGFVGYFSYNYIKYSEKKLSMLRCDKFSDLDLMLFDKVIAYDHLRQKISIIVNVKTDNFEVNYEKAKETIDSIALLINSQITEKYEKSILKSPFNCKATKQNFFNIVKKAKDYIKNGDIFQVVLSRRFEASFKGNLLDTYRVLRTTNPSPYMFYIKFDDLEIAGTSPETLIKLQNGKLSTFPVAGTRPRGKDDEHDKQLEKELLEDEKELAEHNMLVDLARNDIGKISKFGSVVVSEYKKIHRFSHVMHITSIVNSQMAKGKDALDAIGSTLPAGTLSGAPKIRACEIIDELEQTSRGIYGGAIGYIDFSGNMDTCIAIRMAVLKDEKINIQAGAGIVADSVPEHEYIECENKAKALIDAVLLSQEGMQ